MRSFFLVLAWSCVVGSVVDGALLLYAVWINYLHGWLLLCISINDFLRDYIQPLFWVKQVAFLVLPEAMVLWLFNLPALLYFPVRIITSTMIGYWALSRAAELSRHS
tara:strand:+ start:382 stop:702 length:321 start_codon:yes stop_codon:yes gene_type:complete